MNTPDEIEMTSPAHKDGVRTLYKFMKYPVDGIAPTENAEYRRRVETLLLGGELYFATAKELNDPFEASPHFRSPSTSPDDLIKEVLGNFRSLHAPKKGLNEEQIATREKTLTEEVQSGAYLPRIDGGRQKERESFRSDNPMCCFSASRDSTLMWSYYSGGHTGICIHFDATKPPFTNAERVIYSEHYPTFPFFTDEIKPKELRTLAFLTKSLVWNHEQEYRLINMIMTYPSEKPIRALDDIFQWKTPQLAVIPPYFNIGVTVGVSMQNAEIENILRICHDRPIKIPVYQAKCKQDRFDLEFVKIA